VYSAMITPLVVVTLLVSSNSVSGAGPSNNRAPLPRVSGRSAACSGQSGRRRAGFAPATRCR
jgi:hypothetical protein